MICCDQCEEWYHGDCVGISVGQGKRMEREGKEYICPVCVARLQDAKEERDINRYATDPRFGSNFFMCLSSCIRDHVTYLCVYADTNRVLTQVSKAGSSRTCPREGH